MSKEQAHTYHTDGVQLEYKVRGQGEPLLLIHGGMIADAFEMIADQLAASYQLITYRRRGYHGTPPHENCTISKGATDAVALLDHLGIAVANVAGHSIGGVIALQLALDAPTRVHTLGLLEACVMTVPSAADFGSQIASITEILKSGDTKGALVSMLETVGGPDPVSRLDKTLPAGWFDQALADFPTVFSAECGSLGTWLFGQEQAAAIHQPALIVLGSKSAAIYTESFELLNQWLPNAEVLLLEGTSHMLQWENPDGVASGLLAFLARHPMADALHRR